MRTPEPPVQTREVRAAGPAADADALRTAYLDLLKLTLCELAGTTTASVFRTADGEVLARELAGKDLWLRIGGYDWPRHGLTMGGLERLDDLQRCVEAIVADGVQGDLIEAGTWRGGSSIFMRATLDALGDRDRTVCVADSFAGFAEPGSGPLTGGLPEIEFLAVSLEEVKANFARLGLDQGIEFLPGYFEDTMPALPGRRWSLIRLDGDTRSATIATLNALYGGLSEGGYVVVDDYGALDECRAAVDEFRDANGITEPLEEIDWTGVRWRRTGTAAVTPVPMPPQPDHAPAARDTTREERARRREVYVPTWHESQLEKRRAELEAEVASLRERLATAEQEASALRESPLRRPGAWLAGRVRGARR